MADLIDQEAKRRGVSRAALVAYYIKQQQMTGATGEDTARPQAAPRPKPVQQDPRGPLQRIMDALSGHP